jgi:hypothetical protein
VQIVEKPRVMSLPDKRQRGEISFVWISIMSAWSVTKSQYFRPSLSSLELPTMFVVQLRN